MPLKRKCTQFERASRDARDKEKVHKDDAKKVKMSASEDLELALAALWDPAADKDVGEAGTDKVTGCDDDRDGLGSLNGIQKALADFSETSQVLRVTEGCLRTSWRWSQVSWSLVVCEASPGPHLSLAPKGVTQ